MLTRLLRNQSDIGNATRPFYGDHAANRLTALLRDHLVIAGRLLTAAKAGDSAAFSTAKADWYANGDDVAVFLSTARDTARSTRCARDADASRHYAGRSGRASRQTLDG